MKRVVALMVLFFMTASLINAQGKKNKYQFHTINNIVLVNGNNAVSAAVQSMVGISRGSWFAGAGAGLDYYLFRTIPVFVDFRHEWGKTKNKFFVYGDGGINFSWVEKDLNVEPFIWNGNRSNSFHNGLYTDAGIGYLVGLRSGDAILLSVGHSYKKLREKITYQQWINQEWQTDVNTYALNRIMIKMGLKF